MSKKNSPLEKNLRRAQKQARKMRAQQQVDRDGNRIRHSGVMVSAQQVKQQRFLRVNRLPHSKAVANTFIKDDATQPLRDDEISLILNQN